MGPAARRRARLIPKLGYSLRVSPLLLLGLVIAAASDAAPQAPDTGSARVVTVVDSATGRPIDAAQLLVNGEARAVTDASGMVRVPEAAFAGPGWLLVRKVGYEPESLRVASVTGVSTRIALRRIADLPIVSIAGVRDDFSGFGARCAVRGVDCVYSEQLSARPAARVSDFLGRISGNERRCAGRIDDCIILMRGSTGGRCVPTYYVDGALAKPMPSRGRGASSSGVLADLERFFAPAQLRGIEVYRSGQPIPSRFEAGNGCGSIVIWLK